MCCETYSCVLINNSYIGRKFLGCSGKRVTLLSVASFLLINGASVLTGYRTESWIPEKVLKFAQQFSRLGKSLENRDKVRKNGTKSWGFFKATTLALQVNFFVFVLVKSYSISASYFCRALWIKLCSCFF